MKNEKPIIELPLLNTKYERFKDGGSVKVILHKTYLQRVFSAEAEIAMPDPEGVPVAWSSTYLYNDNILSKQIIHNIDISYNAELNRHAVNIGGLTLFVHTLRKARDIRKVLMWWKGWLSEKPICKICSTEEETPLWRCKCPDQL